MPSDPLVPHQRLRSVCDFGLKIQGTKCLKQNKKQQIKETFVLKMKYWSTEISILENLNILQGEWKSLSSNEKKTSSYSKKTTFRHIVMI